MLLDADNNQCVVRISSGRAEPRAEDDGAGIEPGLISVGGRLQPRFGRADWRGAYVEHLERRIQRIPRDLLSHVRRVMMHHGKAEADQTYGALVDLFLVLGPRGIDLRANLLAKVRDCISSRQHRFLRDHLEPGLNSGKEIPFVDASLLDKGIEGTGMLVVRTDSIVDSYAAVDEARERLRQGDVEGARITLESALENDPGDVPVCDALLDLYEAQGGRRDFLVMYHQLMGRGLACLNRWQMLERHFRAQTEQ